MLLERDAELGILEGLVSGLESTGGKVALVRGEAGIGKSALVNGFAEVRAHETHVLLGACDDLFIPQPLGPFWDIARVEPSLRGPLENGDRPHLLEAVLGLLSRPTHPTILVIEDTHWADEATLDAIRFIGRRIARTNGILLLTYRDGDVDYDHPLRGVIGDIPAGDVVRIQLDGLSMDAVTLIVADSGLDPAAVLAATRGNPLLATEMASGADNGVSSSLDDSVMARVHKLSVGAQETLDALAVIPEPIPRREALSLAGVDESRLRECERRGLLESRAGTVAFRHELIRQTIESAMTDGERVIRHRTVLDHLSEETHPSLLIHCAVEIDDIDRLLDLAPRSARYAAATGSHIQAVADFRQLGPHLARIGPDHVGQLLEDWAREELLVDEVSEAIRLNALARSHYRQAGDRGAESHALARAAHYHENAGQRDRAEDLAREAIEVLGDEPAGPDLARALEVNAYLQMMTGNVDVVLDLVEQTLQAGGPDIDEGILIRSLVHRGYMANVADYPSGRASLDEAALRAEAAGQWYEESRAPFLHGQAAIESHDLPVGAEYAQRALESAVRHELPNLETYARALNAKVLELGGRWDEATDLAREVLHGSAITQMVALPILGAIEARRGRPSARALLVQAWEMASAANEFQRLAPAAIACAEYTWISGDVVIPTSDLRTIMTTGLDMRFEWSPGSIARWLWELGEMSKPPPGIAEPYRLLIDGDWGEAASAWEARGVPFERSLALMHGDQADRLEALEPLEELGATAVAARLRRELRGAGVSVPRGRSREARRHPAGLTARQAEILQLIDEGLSNTQIADRLFLSPRTVESHVAAVLDKLGVSTREEAVSRARADGILGDTA